MAATGATELLLRFCDRLSPLLPYFEFLPRPSAPFPSPPALPPSTLLRYPILHFPAVESLDFIPAPQQESIVKRQRRLPAEVVSDRQVLSRLRPAERDFLDAAGQRHCGKNMLRPAGRCLPRRDTIGRVEIAPLPFRYG